MASPPEGQRYLDGIEYRFRRRSRVAHLSELPLFSNSASEHLGDPLGVPYGGEATFDPVHGYRTVVNARPFAFYLACPDRRSVPKAATSTFMGILDEESWHGAGARCGTSRGATSQATDRIPAPRVPPTAS